MVTGESQVQGLALLIEKERRNHDQIIFYYASSASLSGCHSAALDEFRPGERTNHDVYLSRPVAGYRHACHWQLRLAAHARGRGQDRDAAATPNAGARDAHVRPRDWLAL